MRFGYLRDPLFVACVAAYFVNRWLLKSIFAGGFFHAHLNDLICIPFWVPIMLWAMRKTKLRRDDLAPRPHEIVIPLLIWSWAFEVWLPRTRWLTGLAIADPADVFYYTLGALVAALVWKAWYREVVRQALRA